MSVPHTALHIGPGARTSAATHPAQHHIILGDEGEAAHSSRLPGLTRTHLGGTPARTLLEGRGDNLHLLRQLCANVEVFHLHSTPAQTEGTAFFRQLARMATPDARLILHQLDAASAPHMEAAGFLTTSPHEARYRGGLHRDAPTAHVGDAHAIIIGAGLAGSAAAFGLARRGWRVTVFETHPHAAGGASGNLAGVISPLMSKDQNLASRLSRASFLYLLDELRAFESMGAPVRWAACGVMQLAKDARDEALFEALSRLDLPQDFCQPMSRSQIEARFKQRAPARGLFFPQGGWVNPPSLCQARLRHPNITVHCSSEIESLHREGEMWQARHQGGIDCAPVMILANSYAANLFPEARGLHFKTVRGQTTHLSDAALPALSSVWQRDGYLTPEIDGTRCLAATYDFDNTNPALDPASHQQNLARLHGLFPDFERPDALPTLGGRVGFRGLTIDRLPLVGALPDFSRHPPQSPRLRTLPRQPGLFGLLGLGSRGITWSALAGESLASLLNAEPLPIEQDLMDAIDPARFWLRSLRTGASQP